MIKGFPRPDRRVRGTVSIANGCRRVPPTVGNTIPEAGYPETGKIKQALSSPKLALVREFYHTAAEWTDAVTLVKDSPVYTTMSTSEETENPTKG